MDPPVYSEQGTRSVADVISTHSYEHYATFIQILMKKNPNFSPTFSLEPHINNTFSGHECKSHLE